MGKRPYYIIKHTKDYDGYECYVDYIGTNYKAALHRYKKLIDYIKQRWFIDDGVDENNIEQRIDIPQHQLLPGQATYSYLNDSDCFYISIEMSCMETNKFAIADFEQLYKRDYPDSKY